MGTALPWYRFTDKRPQPKEKIKIHLEDRFTEIIKDVVYESETKINDSHLTVTVSENGTLFNLVGFTKWQKIEQIFEPKFFWEE